MVQFNDLKVGTQFSDLLVAEDEDRQLQLKAVGAQLEKEQRQAQGIARPDDRPAKTQQLHEGEAAAPSGVSSALKRLYRV